MNVALYVNSFFPSLGGKEFVVHHLATALARLGHRVRVVGPAGFWKHRRVRPSYPVHRWPTLRGRFPEQVQRTNLWLDTKIWGADVIHAHLTYPNGYTALKLRGRKPLPVIVTPHGADIQTIPELGHGLRLDPALNEKIVWTVKQADIVTAISKNIESVILDAGADPARVRHVPNGVDFERFQREPSTDAKRSIGLDVDSRLIVTVGGYNPRKGFEYLIRAMPKVLETEPRARAVIVGPRTEPLRPLIDELGLADKVVLTGGVAPPRHSFTRSSGTTPEDREDRLAALLCSSEAYVSAGIHRNSEGLSLAVLEGMAAGLPVVATDISGNTDIVDHERNGLLVEPRDEGALADGILRVLENDEERARLGEAARATALESSWLNVARRYLEIYEEATAAAVRAR